MKERFLDRLDLPEEPGFGETLVEVTGHRRVLIENHRGVTQYGSCRICVKVKFGCVSIMGGGLELTLMTKDQLIISGCIETLQLERREGD